MANARESAELGPRVKRLSQQLVAIMVTDWKCGSAQMLVSYVCNTLAVDNSVDLHECAPLLSYRVLEHCLCSWSPL